MLITISVNGADNVGKSTLIDHMPMNDVEIRSNVSEYDDLLSELKKKHILKEWLFKKSTHEELISVTMRATNKRANVIPRCNTKFLIYDRGGLMCEAVCIATIACKEKCDLIQAATIYTSIRDKYGIHIPFEDIRILLKHGYCLEDSLKISLNREREHDELYDEYQILLQRQLLIQESNNHYTDVINVTDMSIIQVQNQVRTIVRKYCFPLFIDATRYFNPMFEHVNIIIGFNGISESEESILIEGICRKLESVGVTCQHLQITSNILDSNELVKQLDDYLNRHYSIAAVIIEGYHRFRYAQFLKRILGDLLQIVNVDVTKSLHESINDNYELVKQKCEKMLFRKNT